MQKLKKGGFTFKHFFVAHDRSPMKVTTDSCLLGAWAPIDIKVRRVLDIGTGCGVIALMLAQRLAQQPCQIDAVDINEQAILQCQQNIQEAPFNNITTYLQDINQFNTSKSGYYDLIVTNPPYFEPAVSCRNQQRQQARYTESLNFQQLITTVKRLLTSDGKFCLVLPYHLAELFKQLCENNQLLLCNRLNLRYTVAKPYSLTLMCFSPCLQITSESELYLRDENGKYSDDFKQLLADFYLFRSSATNN